MITCAIIGAGQHTYAETTNTILTLQKTLEWTLRNSPELAAARHGTQAAEGAALQAGAWPNPELELEVAEFGGWGARKTYAGPAHGLDQGGAPGDPAVPTGRKSASAWHSEHRSRQEAGDAYSREGYEAAQTTIRLSQSVELGGKRSVRQRAAQSKVRLAGWEYAAVRLEVLTRSRKAFVDVLLAQAQLALAEAQLILAEDVRKGVVERVKSGKVPFLEETKAGVEVANARIARERTSRKLDRARRGLATSCGGNMPDFQAASGDLDSIREVPSLAACLSQLDATPEVARWKEEVVLAREMLTHAEAERIPDVNVSAGVSRFEEGNSYAVVASISLPLPVFDRKVGAIRAAEQQATRAEHAERAAQLRATTELVEAHGRLEMARSEALISKTELVPGAQQAFDTAQTGYREGKFGHLEVLDAQRTLSEAKARYLDVLADYHKAATDVERLTGTPLNTIQ